MFHLSSVIKSISISILFSALTACGSLTVDSPDAERLAAAIENFDADSFNVQPDIIGSTMQILAVEDYVDIVTGSTSLLTNQLQLIDGLTGVTDGVVNGQLLTNGLTDTSALTDLTSLTAIEGLTNGTQALSGVELLTQDLIGTNALTNDNALNLTNLVSGLKL